ncbi:MAG TPA: MATE family efflux transporter [Pseudonocardiaceae bacterium]
MSTDTVPGAAAGIAQRTVSYRRIVALAAPMVLSSVVVMGSQVVVTGLVGRMGEQALYIRSVYAPLAFLFVAATTGLAVTLQVLVARCAGSGKRDAVAPLLGSVARVGVALGVLLGAALVALSGALAALFSVPPAHIATFQHFLLFMAAANVLGMLGELCSAVLRGIGAAGVSAILTGGYVALTIGLIAGFGLGLHAGLMIVPAGTALAGTLEVVAGLTVLVRRGVIRPARLVGWRPEVSRRLLAIGFPVAASYLMLSAVNLLLLRVVAPGGPDAVAGFSVGYTVQSFVVAPTVGFGSAIGVLMNQHLAAGAITAARTAFRKGVLLVACCYAVVTVALIAYGTQLVGQLSDDPRIVEEAARFTALVGPTFGCTGLILAVLTVLEQTGHGGLAVAMNASYFAAIIVIGALLVASTHDIDALYRTMRIAALAGLASGLPFAWWIAIRRTPAGEPS